MTTKGFACLTAVVLFCELLLGMVFSGNLADDLISLLLSFGAAVLFCFALCGLLALSKDKKWMKLCVFAALIPLLIVAGFWCLVQFSQYAASVMLSGVSVMIPLLIVGGIGVYLSVKGEMVLSKMAVVSFLVCAAVLVILTAAALPFVTPEYLLPHDLPTLGGITAVSMKNGLPLLSAVLPVAVFGSNRKKKGLAAGFFAAALASLAVFTVTAGILTDELAATEIHPFSVAVSAASMGRIFSRLDGLLYAVGFFGCVLKTAACFSAAKILVQEIISLINIQKN